MSSSAAPPKSRAMSGKATLTMNRSRLASTIPAQTIARTWLGFVRLTGMSATSTADLRLTLHAPFAVDDESRTVQLGLEDRDALFPEIAAEAFGRNGDWRCERSMQQGTIAASRAGRSLTAVRSDDESSHCGRHASN